MSTQNICLKLWIRKYLQFYAENICLTKPMYFSHLPPSQGGRYAGFGNTVEKKKEDDLLENTLSSLASVSISSYMTFNAQPYSNNWPKVIKLFSCSAQLNKRFQLLMKTKIPTNKEVSCFKSLRCCIYHANKV